MKVEAKTRVDVNRPAPGAPAPPPNPVARAARRLLAKTIPSLTSSGAFKAAEAHRHACTEQRDWVCPVSQERLRDLPVAQLIVASDDQAYARGSLQAYVAHELASNQRIATSPVTRRLMIDETRALVDPEGFARLEHRRATQDAAVLFGATLALPAFLGSLGCLLWSIGATVTGHYESSYRTAAMLIGVALVTFGGGMATAEIIERYSVAPIRDGIDRAVNRARYARDKEVSFTGGIVVPSH